MHFNSPKRSKLAVHVVGSKDNADEKLDKIELDNSQSRDEPMKIIDIVQFKANQCLYPLPKPFINIPRKGTQQQSKL